MRFSLKSSFKPKGDQEKAIKELVEGFQRGNNFQTLLGVTGSGKTFTVANVIEKLNLPTLIISHNKTLAAQLYQEFKSFFPENAVEYFISYYDYYIPEAYLPTTDTYIAKETLINKEIDRMRLSATRSLYERNDVIIVASVSCIYGIGDPNNYFSMRLNLQKNRILPRKKLLNFLAELRYERTEEIILQPSMFRVRGGVFDVFPPYHKTAIRLELMDDIIENVFEIDPVSGFVLREIEEFNLYPTNYFITPEDKLSIAIKRIKNELRERVSELKKEGKLLEAQRLQERTYYDLELLEEMGYCPGIENYSRHLSLREEGEPPYTLIDYFPDDFLIVIDESHMTIPQLRAMYEGDRSRKKTLVEHGFRLPSALDNRPLKFSEIEERFKKVLFLSATPSEYEIKKSGGIVVEQIIRPTGLVDPEVEVKPTKNQMEIIEREVSDRIKRGERVLITTLTKRMAEKLAAFLFEKEFKAKYLHSDLDALERIKLLMELRRGDVDIIVGINLLREGLDLPEVSLVIILDADKEGYLRSETSLIQTFGRAARNINGKVILFADKITLSMEKAIAETNRRRRIQIEYNKKHGIKPSTVQKEIKDFFYKRKYPSLLKVADKKEFYKSPEEAEEMIKRLEKEMREAADRLEFEKAAALRDKIKEIEELILEF